MRAAEIEDMREQMVDIASFMDAEVKRLRKEARPLSYAEAEPGQPSRKYELEQEARGFEIVGDKAQSLHMSLGFLIGVKPPL